MRKVVRGQATVLKYDRGVQPAPKPGAWLVLTEIMAAETKLPRCELRSTERLFEELRGRGYDGAHGRDLTHLDRHWSHLNTPMDEKFCLRRHNFKPYGVERRQKNDDQDGPANRPPNQRIGHRPPKNR